MSVRYLLGVDIGSSACKITLLDSGGNLLYTAAQEYPTYYPRPGWAEQDPADWYAAVCQSIAGMSAAGHPAAAVDAVCLSAPTHTAVLLDRRHNVLRRAILWTDRRSAAQAERLEREAGADIFRISCNKVSPVWTLPQLLWVKENEPAIWHATSGLLFAKDYVRWRLTGVYLTDYIDALGSMLFAADKQEWSPDLCQLLELPADLLPPVMSPAAPAGEVGAAAAQATGLRVDTPVITGATDTALEVFAAGAVQPGQATLKLATAGRICSITSQAYPHPQLFNYPHVSPGLWYPGTGTKSCASSYRWLRDVLCGPAGSEAYRTMDAWAAEAPAGAEGLIFHPYLLGELSPYGDPDLKGGFTGATMRHTKAHFARAVLEGVAFSLRDCLTVLDELGISASEFRIIGGGAVSPLWRQIVGDVLGRRVVKPVCADSSLGGAMLAGIGTGVWADAAEAAACCVKVADRTEPDMERHRRYEALFEVYKEVHDSLAGVYRRYAEVLG